MKTIPLTQFIGGLFYWYLIRKRGISHSILAHAEHNTAATAAFFLSQR